MIADIRWFSPNRFGALVVPGLRDRGLTVATEGDRPAKLAVAIDAQVADVAFEFARRRRCPLAVYVWDLPPWRLGKGRPDFVLEAMGRTVRFPRLVGGYPERAAFYSRLRFIARTAQAVWVPSRATAADLNARFELAPEVVPYCYDSARLTKGRWLPGPPLRLLAVSRLVAHKNHGAVIRGAAKLGPSCGVQIIGQGAEAANLRALAARLHVDLRLDANWSTDDAVLAAYRHATVVVAMSRFEGFGLTPIEGLAAGVPVVASDIPPHREFLDPATNFVALDDDEALVAAIRSAIARGPLAAPALGGLTIDAAADRLAARCRALIGA